MQNEAFNKIVAKRGLSVVNDVITEHQAQINKLLDRELGYRPGDNRAAQFYAHRTFVEYASKAYKMSYKDVITILKASCDTGFVDLDRLFD